MFTWMRFRWTETAPPPTPPSWVSLESTWHPVITSSSLKTVRSSAGGQRSENEQLCRWKVRSNTARCLQMMQRRVSTTTTTAASRRTSGSRTSTCPSPTWLASWRTPSLRRGRCVIGVTSLLLLRLHTARIEVCLLSQSGWRLNLRIPAVFLRRLKTSNWFSTS